MPFSQNHLWGHVLGAATEGISDFSLIHASFRKPEVSYLDMAIMIYKQILRLQIPINYILLMQVHQTIQDLNEVEPCILLIHPFYTS